MINLPKLTDLDVSSKRVLVRLDLDTNPDPNDLRIKISEGTLNFLKANGAEIIIIGHCGRPGGKFDESLSLKPFQKIFDKWGAKVEENLRFNPGEEKNDFEFAKKLALLGDCYVNEAFATSHRNSASIVSLPRLLPHAAGLRFVEEVNNLSKVFDNPKKPVVFILGGVKKDKLDYLGGLAKIADIILVGGKLPVYLQDTRYPISDTKIIAANLSPDKEDITLNSIERFEKEIEKAGTIVLSGPLGKYEDEGHRQGTERIFKAVANSSAFKVAGGGDTEKAVEVLSHSALSSWSKDLSKEFDWISVGGGAMLEFLAKRTLPGIKALESANVNIERG